MADETTRTEQPQPATPAVEATAAPAGADDFDALIADFEKQTASSQPGAQPPAPEQARQTPTNREASQADDAQRGATGEQQQAAKRELFDDIKPFGLDPAAQSALINDNISVLTDCVSAIVAAREAERHAALDRQMLDAIMHEFAPAIAGLTNLPPDIIKLRLIAEEQLNPALRNALAQRRENRQEAAKAAHQAVARIVREAEKENLRLDPENIVLRHDREMVTAAVMRSSGLPPEPKPVNVNKLSDDDLKKHMKEKHGYTPHF